METSEELLLSGLQHFAFCRRQWALIHIEGQWAENLRTVEGGIIHERAHDPDMDETRGDLIVLRGLNVISHRLCVTGTCDVVECRKSAEGVKLHGREGLWQPMPVEYKRGSPKEGGEDVLQLVGQALCLEEMFACPVPRGALYYHETRRRVYVEITDALKDQVTSMIREMNDYMARGYTPKPKLTKACNACSLADLCLPKLTKTPIATEYLKLRVEEGEE